VCVKAGEIGGRGGVGIVTGERTVMQNEVFVSNS